MSNETFRQFSASVPFFFCGLGRKVICWMWGSIWRVLKQKGKQLNWHRTGVFSVLGEEDKAVRHLWIESRQARAGRETRRVSWWDTEKNTGSEGIKTIMWSKMCSHPGSQNEESELERKKVEITDHRERERDVELKILIVQKLRRLAVTQDGDMGAVMKVNLVVVTEMWDEYLTSQLHGPWIHPGLYYLFCSTWYISIYMWELSNCLDQK